MSEPPQILRLSPLLTNFWLCVLWVVVDSAWTHSLPQLALEGAGGSGGLGGWEAPLKGLQLFWPWAHIGFSLPSPFLCVLPPLCLCPHDAVVLPTHLPHFLSASPGVSASPCLCLRRMSRLEVCWRRWVWHSPHPGHVEMWGAGGEAGHEWPFSG